MFNTVATYERLFTPTEGGYLFYPWVWSGGYLITNEEYDRLVADWRLANSWSLRIKLGLAMVAAMVAGVIIIFVTGAPPEISSNVLAGVIALGLTGHLLWRLSAVYRLIIGRKPVVGRRSRDASRAQVASMMSWPMLLWITFGISLGSAFLLFFALRGSWLAGILGIVFAISGYQYWRIVMSKWKARGE